MSTSLGPAWNRLHPNSLDSIPKAGVPSQDLFPSVPVDTFVQQQKVVGNWRATNWTGACDELSKISNPTLIITGTDDVGMAPANYCRKDSRILACANKRCWPSTNVSISR